MTESSEKTPTAIGLVEVKTGRSHFRNHITQNVRFLCRSDFEKLDRELKKEKLRRTEQIEKECRDLELRLKRSVGQLERRHSSITERIRARKIELVDLEQADSLRRVSSDFSFWPKIPTENKIPILLRGENMPASSGVYFLWDKDVVVYVGQSVKLCNRVRLSHDKVPHAGASPKVTFLEFPMEELYFAECFYIGILKPRLNANRQPVFCPDCGKRNHFCNCD